MESLLFSDTQHRFPSFSKPQLLPILIPRGPNLPISSIHPRSFSPAAAVKMDSEEVKLWGGRFEDSVADAVEKFTESISFDKDLYKHDIIGSRAHASMLARQGLITEDDKNSILKGLDEIEGQIERGEFVWRTGREDVHMNIEAALTDLVGEPEKKLHTARRRNDQLALKNEGLRLILPGYTHLQRAQPVLHQHPVRAFVGQGLITEDDKNSILKGLDEIEGQIERGEFVWRTDRENVHMKIEAAPTDLVGEPAKKLHIARSRNDQNLLVALVKLALKNEELRLIVPGYTHLQRAQLGLLQHLFLAFVEQLARYAGRLLDCRKRMNFFPLGAYALACAGGLPIDRFMNPEALGSIAPMRNRPNKDNDEGSCGGGNDRDNDEGSCGGGRGGNGIWIKTFAGVGIVIGGVVGLYLVYKTGQAIEREIMGAVRDWKEAGFPALVNIKIEKVGLKFSIY